MTRKAKKACDSFPFFLLYISTRDNFIQIFPWYLEKASCSTPLWTIWHVRQGICYRREINNLCQPCGMTDGHRCNTRYAIFATQFHAHMLRNFLPRRNISMHLCTRVHASPQRTTSLLNSIAGSPRALSAASATTWFVVVVNRDQSIDISSSDDILMVVRVW